MDALGEQPTQILPHAVFCCRIRIYEILLRVKKYHWSEIEPSIIAETDPDQQDSLTWIWIQTIL